MTTISFPQNLTAIQEKQVIALFKTNFGIEPTIKASKSKREKELEDSLTEAFDMANGKKKGKTLSQLIKEL